MFQEILDLKAEYDQKCKDVGGPAIREHLASFFDKYPTVVSVSWPQYTDYFNDGDPCTFSVHPWSASFEVGDGEDYQVDDNYSESGLPEEAGSELEKLIKSVPEDVMLKCFGDHALVTIPREGEHSVEEYDHD